MNRFCSLPVDPAEITPEPVYLNRRQFMKTVGVAGLAGLAGLLAACGIRPVKESPAPQIALTQEKGADRLTSFDDITNFNNFYEFTTDKNDVAAMAVNFMSSPWNLAISGLVENPQTYTLEEINQQFTSDEHIYRMRCVEGWSMVIPWLGFSLAKLLEKAKPLPEASYVRFISIFDPKQMTGQNNRRYPWPYQEGLRLDEALHHLTLLATGLYGKPMLNQNGSPLRLVVPWKYGFKNIKSIVKIELVDSQPETFWSTIAPDEYGFYANVNPEVPHPRWSQASEIRIGETSQRPTLMFNGYADEVASLYEGMDLNVNY